MASRVLVSAATRDGFSNYRRAGEAWPRGNEGREVLVVDSDEDPPGRSVEGVFAVGRKTLATLQADPHIFIRSAVDATVVSNENTALKARIAELEAENAALKAGTDGDKGGGKKKT